MGDSREAAPALVPATAATTVPAVIPAFDAAGSIADVVRRTRAILPTVLVIDDGSSDATAELARRAGAEVIRHPLNRGKGAALATAFTTIFGRGFEQVVTLDADGQHLPEEIPKLLDAWRQGADLVLGSRAHHFAAMSPLRRVSNRTSSRLISAFAGLELADVQTGFRLYTRALIAATGFPERRFEAESTVVVRAGRRGFRVVAVPIEVGAADGRSTSHYRAWADGLRIAGAVTRARLEILR